MQGEKLTNVVAAASAEAVRRQFIAPAVPQWGDVATREVRQP